MTIISAVPGSSGDAYARLVDGLRMELGCSDIAALADRIFEAEKVDFHWQARVRERYLGQHFPLDFGDEDACDDVSRIAILSFVAGRWHAGVCLVDGDGCAVDLLWLRSFDRRDECCRSVRAGTLIDWNCHRGAALRASLLFLFEVLKGRFG